MVLNYLNSQLSSFLNNSKDLKKYENTFVNYLKKKENTFENDLQTDTNLKISKSVNIDLENIINNRYESLIDINEKSRQVTLLMKSISELVNDNKINIDKIDENIDISKNKAKSGLYFIKKISKE